MFSCGWKNSGTHLDVVEDQSERTEVDEDVAMDRTSSVGPVHTDSKTLS